MKIIDTNLIFDFLHSRGIKHFSWYHRTSRKQTITINITLPYFKGKFLIENSEDSVGFTVEKPPMKDIFYHSEPTTEELMPHIEAYFDALEYPYRTSEFIHSVDERMLNATKHVVTALLDRPNVGNFKVTLWRKDINVKLNTFVRNVYLDDKSSVNSYMRVIDSRVGDSLILVDDNTLYTRFYSME